MGTILLWTVLPAVLAAVVLTWLALRRPAGPMVVEVEPVRCRRCPGCGSPVVLMDRSEPAAGVRAYCYKCDYVGPWGRDEGEARALWNEDGAAEELTDGQCRALLARALNAGAR